MRVVHLTGKDYFGAGRAAYRLHKGLQRAGVDSLMLVGDKRSDDDSVINVQSGFINMIKKKILTKLEKRFIKRDCNNLNGMFSTGIHGFSIAKTVNSYHPDIIHLHWINRGYMKLSDVLKLEAPVVITMHDVWYFTGICHYAKNCQSFTTECGNCVQIGSKQRTDVCTYIQTLKQEIYKKKTIDFIAPSRWMQSEALKSHLLKNQKVHHLSNGIDTSVFSYNKSARKKLGLPMDKKLVLFAAVDATSDENKGFDLLSQAIDQLDENRFELIVIGGSEEDQFPGKTITIHNIGYVGDDALLIDYLSSTDVVVVPSKQENLSNLIMEGLSCSKPVVAFGIGGNGDMIRHKENGYLAVPFDTKDLADGIGWCVENEERTIQLSQNARQQVESIFGIDEVSKRHIECYSRIMEEHND